MCRISSLILLLTIQAGSWTTAAETVTSLSKYLPRETNGLAIVRVKELYQSPRAVAEKWQDSPKRFLMGAGVPSWVDVFVMGTEVHPGRRDGWSATLVPLPEGATFAALAKHEGAEVQSIGDVSAAHVKDSYFLELTPAIVGVLSPGHRQDAARWGRDSKNAEQRLTPFLQMVCEFSEPIVMGLDMKNMLDPRAVAQRLASSPALDGKEALKKSLDTAFNGLEGAVLRAKVTSGKTFAQVAFHFSDVLPNAPQELKALFLESLADEQMTINDLTNSDPRIDGKVFILTAQLSDVGLRQVLSLVVSAHPNEPIATAKPRTDPGAAPTNPTNVNEVPEMLKARVNQDYYSKVNGVLKDLEREAALPLTNYMFADKAIWVENASARIASFSIQGVDPDLAKFGSTAASKLNAIASSLRGMQLKVAAAQSTFTYQVNVDPVAVGGWGGGWGRWGRGWRGGWGRSVVPYYNVDSNLAEVRKKQADAVVESATERDKIWQSLLSDRDAIRQTMEQRYKQNFGGF